MADGWGRGTGTPSQRAMGEVLRAVGEAAPEPTTVREVVWALGARGIGEEEARTAMTTLAGEGYLRLTNDQLLALARPRARHPGESGRDSPPSKDGAATPGDRDG